MSEKEELLVLNLLFDKLMNNTNNSVFNPTESTEPVLDFQNKEIEFSFRRKRYALKLVELMK